ncbi:MAG: hypothetical protein R3B45_16620, partial [Bdellovibrionota bacterium]
NESQVIERNPEAKAAKVAARFAQMIDNMTLNSQAAVLPFAFFAMIKDFEVALNKKWSEPLNEGELKGLTYEAIVGYGPNASANDYANRHGIYVVKNHCDAPAFDKMNNRSIKLKKCFGLFQVDIIGSSTQAGSNGSRYQKAATNAWDPYMCGEKGLNIASKRGGMDFCFAFYWLLLAEGGKKCRDFMQNARGSDIDGRVSNPCNDKPDANNIRAVDWTYKLIGQGTKVYGQAIQDAWRGLGINLPWAIQYLFYENLLLSELFSQKTISGTHWKGSDEDISVPLTASEFSKITSNYILKEVPIADSKKSCLTISAARFRKSIGLPALEITPDAKASCEEMLLQGSNEKVGAGRLKEDSSKLSTSKQNQDNGDSGAVSFAKDQNLCYAVIMHQDSTEERVMRYINSHREALKAGLGTIGYHIGVLQLFGTSREKHVMWVLGKFSSISAANTALAKIREDSLALGLEKNNLLLLEQSLSTSICDAFVSL